MQQTEKAEQTNNSVCIPSLDRLLDEPFLVGSLPATPRQLVTRTPSPQLNFHELVMAEPTLFNEHLNNPGREYQERDCHDQDYVQFENLSDATSGYSSVWGGGTNELPVEEPTPLNEQEHGWRDQDYCQFPNLCDAESGWSCNYDSDSYTAYPLQPGPASIHDNGETTQTSKNLRPKNNIPREVPVADEAAAREIINHFSITQNEDDHLLKLSTETKETSLNAQRGLEIAAGLMAVDDLKMFISPWLRNVLQACKGRHANYVMSKLFQVMPICVVRHVAEAMLEHALEIAVDRFGARCITDLIFYHGRSGDAMVQSLIDELRKGLVDLTCSKFGWCVVSDWLSYDSKDAEAVVIQLQLNMKTIMNDKFGVRALMSHAKCTYRSHGCYLMQLAAQLSLMPPDYFLTQDSRRLHRELAKAVTSAC
jgi:hypothetical protein